MAFDIEQVLRASKVRYTKEVQPDSEESFSVPFDSSAGPIVLHVFAMSEKLLYVHSVLRNLDSLAVRSTRDLLRDLLRLNGEACYARVFLWTSPEDETDWIRVEAALPSDSVTPGSLVDAVADTAHLADRVLQTISSHTTAREAQTR